MNYLRKQVLLMKKTKQFLWDTAVLTIAALFMRTVGVSFNVYLTNQLGAAGIGLFQLVMTVFSMAITFASSGIRLAATRLVVDAISKDRADVKKVLRRCLLSILLVAVVVALILYTGSDLISQHWLYDSRTAQPLRLLSLSLPFIAMSAALSGYFTAIRRAGVYAGVQVLEQLVRVASTAGFLHMLSGRGLEASCIAIVLGSCVSDLISFLASFFLSKWMVRRQRNQHRVMLHLNRRLLRIAVPDAVGAWVRSILLTIEHLLIPIGFKKSGISSENALATYGTIHAMTLPVLLFPSCILNSLASLLVPEIAEYHALHQAKRIDGIINRVLYAALLFSLLVAGVFYAYAGELSNAVYHSSDTKPFLQLLAVLVPVMYLDMAVDGMLKGLDQQLSSMRYNIIDSGLCVILVYFLIPRYSVKGYIITLFVSEILNFYLSLRRLIRVSTLRLNWRRILNPILCMTCAVTGVRLVATLLPAPLLHSVPWLVGAILATSCAYLLALRCSGGITQQDLHWFAGIFRSERKAAMSVSPQNTGVSI
jgi:stage V sporulation protein B